jgi:hypothetical protein
MDSGHGRWTRTLTLTLLTGWLRPDRVSRDAFTLPLGLLRPGSRGRGRRLLAAPSPAHVTVSRGSSESPRPARAAELRVEPGAPASVGNPLGRANACLARLSTFHLPLPSLLPPCWRAAARRLKMGGPAPALLPVVGHPPSQKDGLQQMSLPSANYRFLARRACATSLFIMT